AAETGRTRPLDIAPGHLRALARVVQRLGAPGRRHPVGDAAAHAAVIETENEPRPLRRAAVDEGIDAERAVGADQAGGNTFQVLETRPPDERAIGEHPKIFLGVIEAWIHRALRGGIDTVRPFRSPNSLIGPTQPSHGAEEP